MILSSHHFLSTQQLARTHIQLLLDKAQSYIPIQLEDAGFVSSSSNTKPGGFLRGKHLISHLNSNRNTARHPNTPRDFLRDNALTENSVLKSERYISPDNTLLLLNPILKHKIVANLFFENSTRTRSSFEIAAHKLGAYILNFDTARSSVQKGETLFDTVDNLAAIGVDLLVIRHSETGMPAQIAEHVKNKIAVINAGDGTNEHPTQAMLDVLTIHRHKPDFSSLTVTIVGDIRHSRVARSLCFALSTLGVPDIRLVGPCALLPTDTSSFTSNIHFHNNLIEGIENADVVVMLRIQQERICKNETTFDLEDYIQCYCLTTAVLAQAKPDAIVMHPGPMNRGIEIESAVADGPQSVILEQARLGVAMRMAIMASLLEGEGEGE